MKKILLFSLLFFCFMSECSASRESANSYIVMDMVSGRVIEGKNYDNKMLIASTTKIMTCILAIESNKLDYVVDVDESILKAYGSGIYIEVGEKLSLRDLLYGLMLRSGNDAALMVASYVSGDVNSFVKLMNDKARDIGMKNTIFVNPSGLDQDDGGNYSTAYDMALLTRYAMKNNEYRKIVSTKSYKVKTNKKSYVWKNKNKLLNYDYITGGKTGYTEKAKRTLVSTGSRDNMNFIVVTLRDSDDWNTHRTLYNDNFSKYRAYRFLNKNSFMVRDKYYKDNLYIKNDVYLPVLDKELNRIKGNVVLEKLDYYKDGDCVGKYNIYLDKELIYSENIYINKKKRNNNNNSIWKKIKGLFG